MRGCVSAFVQLVSVGVCDKYSSGRICLALFKVCSMALYLCKSVLYTRPPQAIEVVCAFEDHSACSQVDISSNVNAIRAVSRCSSIPDQRSFPVHDLLHLCLEVDKFRL